MSEHNIEQCEVCNNKASDEVELYLCDKCECTMCSGCQAPYNQFSQIDYNCCTNCYENSKDRDY